MKHIQRAIALSGLLVLLTFSSALGQSDRQTIIHIPFNFTVGEKTFSGRQVRHRAQQEKLRHSVGDRHKDNVGSAIAVDETSSCKRRARKKHDWSSTVTTIFIFCRSSGPRGTKPDTRFRSPIVRKRWRKL